MAKKEKNPPIMHPKNGMPKSPYKRALSIGAKLPREAKGHTSAGPSEKAIAQNRPGVATKLGIKSKRRRSK